MKRMLAEFEKIQAILMAFPHEFGDWAYCIKEARERRVKRLNLL